MVQMYACPPTSAWEAGRCPIVECKSISSVNLKSSEIQLNVTHCYADIDSLHQGELTLAPRVCGDVGPGPAQAQPGLVSHTVTQLRL